MEKYTFRIDNKDPLYKKLIKLPTAYYRLKKNSSGYTIDSHNSGTVKIKSTHDVKLKWENNNIVLKVKEKDGGTKDYIIEQDNIIGKDKEAIVNKLQEGKKIGVTLEKIEGSDFGVGLSLYKPKNPLIGVLKFINFYDENDSVLQKIIEEKGGLYFTMEDNNIYISDKDGKRLSEYDDYQYQYTQNPCDVLTIGEIIDSLTRASDVQQSFILQKGEELSNDIYEAKVVLNGKTIATLPKIGYYMLDDQLVMRNHVTKEKVVIPRDFHFLKVVKFDNDYKLTFCNVLGNEFFEHKKYDPQYSHVSDEYKFISLSCAKKEYNPNLGELFSHRPSFFIIEGSAEPGSPGYYQADVFELTSNKKGRKMATLIDEFGYFNKDDVFKRCDYHEETEYGVYNPSSIEKEHTITEANSEFILQETMIHTIPQELL
ncbi:hypothetical protein [Candidatus Wolbachia massiliensis]|uniref:Uncharacterized protein n=1 Tax=Candidatus Wolbachia massiliensis TaxID=1845000 RepID=A0A7M3U233_9RICK|nr:hypothetical protein [Candidatus Wolbachia massiliensis]QOD38468.1 hypothetical protein ID128_00955 [Candidatus Wolbachia massiliensis]